jgi:copper(I)-binding protein
MKKAVLYTALIALVAVSGAQAVASPAEGNAIVRDQLSVRGAWVAEALPGQSMTAAYMTISNEGDVDEELVSVESEIAEKLEIHEMVQQGEMMRMRKVDSIVIGPGEEMALEPGGLHIMLIGLTREIKEGDTVELNLIFESGATLTVSAPVKKR